MPCKEIAVGAALVLSAWTTLSEAGTASYVYDALGRVVQVQSSTGAAYQYDALGNWVSRLIAAPPSAPPTITSTTIGAGTVTFAFTAPTTYTGAAITGYVVTCSSGLSASVSANATSVTVAGLIKATTYTCTIASDSAVGTGASTPVQTVVGGSQVIAFPIAVVLIGVTRNLPVTATSGLAVTLTSTTPTTCSVISGTTVRGLAAGLCSLNANQPGNTDFLAAPAISRNLQVVSPAALMSIFDTED